MSDTKYERKEYFAQQNLNAGDLEKAWECAKEAEQLAKTAVLREQSKSSPRPGVKFALNRIQKLCLTIAYARETLEKAKGEVDVKS